MNATRQSLGSAAFVSRLCSSSRAFRKLATVAGSTPSGPITPDWLHFIPGRLVFSYGKGQDERPYCFILRQSVTVPILSASAALRRLPPNRSRARSIMTFSCCWRSSVSSPGRTRGF